MFKKGIYLIIIIFIFTLACQTAYAQDGALDIVLSVNSPTGVAVPSLSTDLLAFNMVTSSTGPVTINNLTLKEANANSQAQNYKLYRKVSSNWVQIAEDSVTSDGLVDFNNINLTIIANGFEQFLVRANTINTKNTYRLDIQAVVLDSGSSIDSFPIYGTMLIFPEETVSDGNLTVEFSSNSASGRQDQGTTNLLNVILTSDSNYRSNNTKITEVKFQEAVGSGATSFTLQTMNTTLAQNVNPVNGIITFSNLNLSMSTATLPLWLNASTQNVTGEYRLDLIEITTDKNITITGLPVQSNTLGFYTRLNGVSTSESPSGDVVKSNSTKLIKAGVKAQGRSAVIYEVLFKELVSNTGIKSLKLIRSDQPSTIIKTVAPSAGLVQFINLNIPIAKDQTIYFEVIADTTQASGQYKLQLDQVHITETSATYTEYYWFPVIGGLVNIVSTVTAPTAQLTVSLDPETPDGETYADTETALFAFNLSATGGDIVVDSFVFEQETSKAEVTEYALANYTDGILLDVNVNPNNGVIRFFGFDQRILAGQTITFVVFANTENWLNDLRLRLTDISTWEQTDISGLPLIGKTVSLTEFGADLEPILLVDLADTSPTGQGIQGKKTLVMEIIMATNQPETILKTLVFQEVYAGSTSNSYSLYSAGDLINPLSTVINPNGGNIVFNVNRLLLDEQTGKDLLDLVVMADTTQTKNSYRLELKDITTSPAVTVIELPVLSNVLAFPSSALIELPPPPLPPAQPISAQEKLYQDRVSKLGFKINAADMLVIQREKDLLSSTDQAMVNRTKGKILLQVESVGEAWYVDPLVGKKFYLKDGESAYIALNAFGLGITNADLVKIPVGVESRFQLQDSDKDGLADQLEDALGTNKNNPDTDGDGYFDATEIKSGYSPTSSSAIPVVFDQALANRLKGRILLQVQSQGQAWYINPADGKRYYLQDGEMAYQIMRFLSLGITNIDLRLIPIGELF